MRLFKGCKRLFSFFLMFAVLINVVYMNNGLVDVSADTVQGIFIKEESIVNYGNELMELEDFRSFEMYMAMRNITTETTELVVEFEEPVELKGTTQEEVIAQNKDEINSISKAAQIALDAFVKDYPEIFWFDYGKSTFSGLLSQENRNGTIVWKLTGVKFKFYKVDSLTKETSEAYDEVMLKLNELVSNSKDMKTYDRLKYYHDYLCENIEYDRNSEEYNVYNIYGALCEGHSVCEGYAESFKALCDLSQIPCILVSGNSVNNAGESEPHIWNYCLMDDDKWYAVDVTMDDLSEISYDNFLCGSETVNTSLGRTFSDIHIPEGDFSLSGYYTFSFPQLSEKSYKENNEVPYSGILGDLNGSGKVDSMDALLVLQHVAKIALLNEQQLTIADVNESDSIDATDALNILQYAARIIDKLPPESDKVIYEAEIVSGGDLLISKTILDGAVTEDGAYDFDYIFRFVNQYVSEADYAVVNLETSVAGDIVEYCGFPRFNTPDNIIDAAKDAGFDMFLTASNHSYDIGYDGLINKINFLKDKDVDFIGTRADENEPFHKVIDVNGIKIGMLNYTQETSSSTKKETILNSTTNAETGEREKVIVDEAGKGLISTYNKKYLDEFYATLKDDIQYLKDNGAEIIVAYPHWGNEYNISYNETEDSIAQTMCDYGVDVIIGGHPHVVEPVKVYTSEISGKTTICIHSTGNFVSSMRSTQDKDNAAYTEDGVLFKYTVAKYADGSVKVTSADVLPLWVYNTKVKKYTVIPLDKSRDWKEDFGVYNYSSQASSGYQSYIRTMDLVTPGIEEFNKLMK